MANVWEMAILKSIESLGGEAMLQQIYRKLSDYIEMGGNHLRETQWGGRPAYQHQVRSHISNLVQAGELVRVARAEYGLTKKGIVRLKRLG